MTAKSNKTATTDDSGIIINAHATVLNLFRATRVASEILLETSETVKVLSHKSNDYVLTPKLYKPLYYVYLTVAKEFYFLPYYGNA